MIVLQGIVGNKILSLLLHLLKILLVYRLHHEVQCGRNPHQGGHGVHCVVVEEGRGIDSALGHYCHQLCNCQCLGFYQALSRAYVRSKLGCKSAGVYS